MSHQYSTALSYGVLTGVSIYAAVKHHDFKSFQLPYISYGLILTHSALGLFRWAFADNMDQIEKPYNHSFFLQSIFALPCVTAQLWLNGGYDPIIAYAHPVLSFVPLAAYVANKDRPETVDLFMFLNALSCIFVSVEMNNMYGIGAGATSVINQYIINRKDEIFNAPARDFYNYIMCAFVLCALYADRH